MKSHLIYQDYKSKKFWKIAVEGKDHTVNYGQIGTDGTSRTKTFASEALALADAEKLVKAKKRKGYVESEITAQVIRNTYVLAGKPIKDFGSTIRLDTGVRVFSYYDDKVKVPEKLDKLAKLPEAAALDTLLIGSWNETHDIGPADILKKLIDLKDTFSELKHLFVGDMSSEDCEISWIIQTDYSDFYNHFPALETFGVKGGQELTLGKIQLPNLKNLIVETGGLDAEVIADIMDSHLSNLAYLDLWLGTEEYGCTVEVEDLQPILNGKYPNLKYLGLKNYDKQDELAAALNGASVLENLETLDLSMGTLSDKGAEALYNNEALLNLKHINCRHHFISKEWQDKLKTKFAAQNINLNDAEEADDYGDDEVYYYVEIGE